ncbi:hypothetical protein [Streptomyces beigongshangae]|uniref:hypothetical protein n=1 Tax=Streptomyces beigongshangae TaxID=2841597 RepID=UPI001C85C935|nr:hypothetical protein [Streptomyces sp. REN17]
MGLASNDAGGAPLPRQRPFVGHHTVQNVTQRGGQRHHRVVNHRLVDPGVEGEIEFGELGKPTSFAAA